MANGDQGVVGGAREMFTIRIPAGAVQADNGDFEVTPERLLSKLVIKGPTNSVAVEPDGQGLVTVTWEIAANATWSISIL